MVFTSTIIKNVLTAGILSTGLVVTGVTSVQAITFNWSFSNVIGGEAGTVSGTLEVAEGFGVAATSVVLTSTTNPLFDSLVGFDFTTLANFSNQFNVEGGEITAAQFGTDFFANATNISLELNADVFADMDSPNLALLTIAGNPLPADPNGGDDACPDNCLQTADLFDANGGQTQFAPTFTRVPETSPTMGLLVVLGLMGVHQLRKTKQS